MGKQRIHVNVSLVMRGNIQRLPRKFQTRSNRQFLRAVHQNLPREHRRR
ncbi:unnamed protein product [Gongylonema pulchrum]|uniref:Transposase n=1 Tax=Gongylonema pulchrum TaxID=637853 RepID=A0A183CUK5_9BILA|nr:unnamed protein product [Gongylonema pulchrum]